MKIFAALSRVTAHSSCEAAADAQADLRAQWAEPQSPRRSRAVDLWRGDADRRAAAHESRAQTLGHGIEFRQSNKEGELVDWIQEAREKACGIILNAGAYTHTSVAILDALNAAEKPVIELHLSNVFRRETFRHHSYVSPAAQGVICGFGPKGYELAVEAMADIVAASRAGTVGGSAAGKSSGIWLSRWPRT